jgi:cyanophycin synthetase
MLDLTRHPRLLRLLARLDRVKRLLDRGRHAREQHAERNLSAFYARVWREAAAQVGARIDDLGHDVFEMRLGEARTRVLQNCTDIDGLGGQRVVRSKPVMYRLLAQEGLPTPGHLAYQFEDMGAAAQFLEEAGGPCVVKPACGTGGGLGVTTGVRTRWQLARASQAAARHGGGLLIERQVAGDNYRLLYLDGKLLDAVVRRAPAVVGDGRGSVARLVEAVNARRLEGGPAASHSLLTVDLDMKNTLARQGLSLRSVPAAGRVVRLKTASNQNAGADNETATALLCAAVVADGARAAAASGLRLAGVDVLTGDPGVPLREAGGVVLEVNSPPGYFWHYHKRDGAFPLAVHVLECLLGSPRASELSPA